MQLRRIGSKQAEQVPQKKKHWCERDQQRVSHLRGQSGRIGGRGFPDQPAENSPHRAKYFHVSQSLLCRPEISIKLAESPSPPSSPSGRGSRNAAGEGKFFAYQDVKRILILTAAFGELR